MMARPRSLFAGALSVLATLSCGGSTEPDPPDGPAAVAEVRITSPVTSVIVGATAQLAAQAFNSDGAPLANRPMTWGSSNTAVMTVSAAGLVTGKTTGTATITASSEGKSASVELDVSPIPVGLVAVSPTTAQVPAGQTVALTATTSSATGTPLPGRPVAWTSADPAIATVDAGGTVLGVKKGTVAITATSEGISGSATVEVLPSVATVTVSPGTATIPYNGSVQLSVAITDGDGGPLEGREVEWSSGNQGIAVVTTAGLVQPGSAAGTAVISATVEGVQGSMTVTVLPIPVASIDVSPTDATIVPGGKIDFVVWPLGPEGQVLSIYPLTSSVSPGIAVTLEDVLHARAIGTGDEVVTFAAGGVEATATLRVRQVSLAAVDAGAGLTCGTTQDGTAFCWGSGNGDMASSATPRSVPGDPVYDLVRSGSGFSCGLLAGAVSCWGIEPASGVQQYEPVAVPGAPAFIDIDVGDEAACGLTAGGAAYCWGRNYIGHLGNGTTMPSASPTAVSGGHAFIAITVGRFHACGLTGDGKVYCWGGDTSRLTPELASGDVEFASITANFCGLDGDGMAWCWSDLDAVPVPVALAGHTFTSITSRGHHACGLKADGSAHCWGDNEFGALGTGDFDNRASPAAVVGGLQFTSLTAGGKHTCGQATDGRFYCWGAGGIGSEVPFPGRVTEPSPVTGQP